MALFSHTFDFIRQLWYAIDTASALQHGGSASETARRYIMATPAQTAPVAPAAHAVA